MKERNEFQNIIDKIINSYEIKVKTVASLMRQVVQKIKGFHEEQIRMADKLKDILAKNRSLRRKDFDTMMADIRIKQSQREKEISQMVEDFCKEEEEMVGKLREIISGNIPCAFKDFNILKKRMLNRPKESEKKLSRMLKNFHQEQQELAAGLQKLLEKGPEVRIKDFKAMIKAFHIEHHDEIIRVDEILDEFERVKDEIGSQWQKVIANVSKGEYRAPLAES